MRKLLARTLTFLYDQLGRNTKQTSSVLGNVSFQYDLAGRRTRVIWPDSFYVQYDYDLADDLTAVRENNAASGPGVLATYAYDNLGRETAMTRGNGTTEAATYDNASNLATLSQDLSGTSYDQTLTLSYNPANQLSPRVNSNAQYQWTPLPAGTQNYTPNGRNQYASVASATYAYDTRGNLTSERVT